MNNPGLRKSENERFLEQFGYIIVASQLLSEQTPSTYNSATAYQTSDKIIHALAATGQSNIGLRGVFLTAAASFVVAWLLRWARNGLSRRGTCLAVLLVAFIVVSGYIAARRQWLRYVRSQSIQYSGFLINNARVFDSAASAAVSLIQEVELVSRGYRM